MLHEVYFSACVSKTYRLVKLVETDSRSLCMLSFYIAFCHMQYWKLGEESQSGNKANKEIKHHPYIVSSYCSIILQLVSDGLYEARPT